MIFKKGNRIKEAIGFMPAMVFGLVFAKRNGNLIIGFACGKTTYFWELVK